MAYPYMYIIFVCMSMFSRSFFYETQAARDMSFIKAINAKTNGSFADENVESWWWVPSNVFLLNIKV